MTPFHLAEVKKLIAEANGAEESDLYQAATNLNVTANCRVDATTGQEIDYLPVKGERVHVNMDVITTSNGVEGLFCVGISPIKARAAKAVSLDELFGSESEVMDKAESASIPGALD